MSNNKIKITTHILDTSTGKPASGISVTLFFQNDKSGWNEIASGVTNSDGRIPDILQEEKILETGIYKITFQTKKYFEEKKTKSFYPFIEIIFEISNEEHYHIPLLLSPFGYSTYRGS